MSLNANVDMNNEMDTNISSENIVVGDGGGVPLKTLSPGTWEQLFNGIQDPVLVVRPDGIIIEANDATLQAARKTRDEVVGQGICKIIHGGRWPHIKCPLEEFLKTCTPKVEETRLPGLFGEYSFSISPVKEMEWQSR